MAIIFPGSPEVGDTYEAPNGIIYQYSDGAWRLSAENQGGIGVYMDTSPPPTPQNGDLWFHTGEADLKIFYVDPSSSQWIPASSPPDPYEENFVSISGDKMTGRLNMEQSAIRIVKQDGTVQFNLSPNTSDYFTNIYSFNSDKSGGMRFRVAPGNDTSGYKTFLTAAFADNQVGDVTQPVKTELNWLRTPTASHHAANKQYVDDAVLQATKKVPGRAYKYSNSHTDNLPRGCFHVEGNGTVQISRWDQDDIEIATAYSEDWKASVKGIITVRDLNGGIKHAQAFDHFYQGENNAYHIRINKSTEIKNGKSGLVEGTTYYIVDGIYNF